MAPPNSRLPVASAQAKKISPLSAITENPASMGPDARQIYEEQAQIEEKDLSHADLEGLDKEQVQPMTQSQRSSELAENVQSDADPSDEPQKSQASSHLESELSDISNHNVAEIMTSLTSKSPLRVSHIPCRKAQPAVKQQQQTQLPEQPNKAPAARPLSTQSTVRPHSRDGRQSSKDKSSKKPAWGSFHDRKNAKDQENVKGAARSNVPARTDSGLHDRDRWGKRTYSVSDAGDHSWANSMIHRRDHGIQGESAEISHDQYEGAEELGQEVQAEDEVHHEDHNDDHRKGEDHPHQLDDSQDIDEHGIESDIYSYDTDDKNPEKYDEGARSATEGRANPQEQVEKPKLIQGDLRISPSPETPPNQQTTDTAATRADQNPRTLSRGNLQSLLHSLPSPSQDQVCHIWIDEDVDKHYDADGQPMCEHEKSVSLDSDKPGPKVAGESAPRTSKTDVQGTGPSRIAPTSQHSDSQDGNNIWASQDNGEEDTYHPSVAQNVSSNLNAERQAYVNQSRETIETRPPPLDLRHRSESQSSARRTPNSIQTPNTADSKNYSPRLPLPPHLRNDGSRRPTLMQGEHPTSNHADYAAPTQSFLKKVRDATLERTSSIRTFGSSDETKDDETMADPELSQDAKTPEREKTGWAGTTAALRNNFTKPATANTPLDSLLHQRDLQNELDSCYETIDELQNRLEEVTRDKSELDVKDVEQMDKFAPIQALDKVSARHAREEQLCTVAEARTTELEQENALLLERLKQAKQAQEQVGEIREMIEADTIDKEILEDILDDENQAQPNRIHNLPTLIRNLLQGYHVALNESNAHTLSMAEAIRHYEEKLRDANRELVQERARKPESYTKWIPLYEVESKKHEKLKTAHELLRTEATKLYEGWPEMQRENRLLKESLTNCRDHGMVIKQQMEVWKEKAGQWEDEYRTKEDMWEQLRTACQEEFDGKIAELEQAIKQYHAQMPQNDPNWWEVEGLRKKIQKLEKQLHESTDMFDTMKSEKAIAYRRIEEMKDEVKNLKEENDRLQLGVHPYPAPSDEEAQNPYKTSISNDKPKSIARYESPEEMEKRKQFMDEFREKQRLAREEQRRTQDIIEKARAYHMGLHYPPLKKDWNETVSQTSWERWEGEKWLREAARQEEVKEVERLKGEKLIR